MAFPEQSDLVIIGNGMVGAKFCELLVQNKLNERFQITVIGAEPVPAYDRIRLSTYVDHRDADTLILKPLSWYSDNGIKLLTNISATAIDRENRKIELSSGVSVSYDGLVLATGSSPFSPPIPGTLLPKVFLYRTIEDIEAIAAASEQKKSAIIIGGGLLGLEAAQAVQKLGLSATVIERANFLMPQQLTETAASFLQKTITDQEIDLLLAASTSKITEDGDQLKIHFEDGETIKTDLIVVSAGIIPNSDLAEESGLRVGSRGGVIVNNQLETDDERIFAIGECALFGGKIYGLAAPGYAMAKHLAERLTGVETAPFQKPDLSTRLKMIGTNVVIIGSPLEEGRRIEYSDGELHRMLVVSPDGDLLGGLGIGEWDESGKIQSLFRENAIIREAEQEHFASEGTISLAGEETTVSQFPDSRLICNCMGITKGELVDCIAKCGRDPLKIAAETGASTVCGSCEPLILDLCGESESRGMPKAAKVLLGISAAALAAVLITTFTPGVKMADSVASWWHKVDLFWRDNVVKQITGYVVAGFFVIGLLLSLRKRFRWFRIGHFAKWRVFHSAFGVASLAALFFHTGFHFGSNLNFWLMFTFVAINLLGAFAGVVAAIESSGTSEMAIRARRVRPFLTYAHVIFFWPLPILLIFHILSVYLY